MTLVSSKNVIFNLWPLQNEILVSNIVVVDIDIVDI